MGLTLTRKGADDAVVEEIRRSEDKSKPLKKLKLKDLPFVDKKDNKIWARLICTLIDWAGMTTPFGMNEHPEVAGKLQELWDVLFTHNKIDVTKCPAIKKVVSDGVLVSLGASNADVTSTLRQQIGSMSGGVCLGKCHQDSQTRI